MAIINPKEFSKRRPKLTIEDFEGGDASALTIAEVEMIKTDDEDGKRTSLVITFSETGEKAYWPNASSIGIIVEEYGKDSDDWIGKPLPLMRHQGTFKGKAYDNLQVAAPEFWQEVIEQSGLTPVRKARAVTKVKPVVKAAKKKAGRGR